jgi:antitoxin component YwqK of YwqJK toxin-antitoxin module
MPVRNFFGPILKPLRILVSGPQGLRFFLLTWLAATIGQASLGQPALKADLPDGSKVVKESSSAPEDVIKGLTRIFLEADSSWNNWPNRVLKNDTISIRIWRIYDGQRLSLEGSIYRNEIVGKAKYRIDGWSAGVAYHAGSLWHGPVHLFHDPRIAGDTGIISFEGKYIAGELEGIAKWYYPNGKLATEAEYENNELAGSYQTYHPDGAKLEIGSYLETKPIGIWQYYAPNGRLCIEEKYDSSGSLRQIIRANTESGGNLQLGSFRNGTGKLMRYTFGGQLKAEENYINGVLEGLSTYYDSTKRIRETCQYLKGQRHGQQRLFWSGSDGGRLHEQISWQLGQKQGGYSVWHPDGKLAINGYYHQGSQDSVWLFYHPEGKLAAKQQYHDQRLHGKQYQWYANGQLKSVVKMLEGLPDSISLSWYSNGKIERQQEHDAGEPIGTWERYYTDGTLAEKQEYIGGQPDGLHKTWHLNGKPETETTWALGKRNGKSSTWYANGNLESSGYYKDDQMVGSWTYYHGNGKIKTTETYLNGLLDRTTTVQDPYGQIISTYTLVNGTGRRQTFHAGGVMASDAHYQSGKLHGRRILYDISGKVVKTERFELGRIVE